MRQDDRDNLDDLLREVKKLRRLEKSIRCIVDDQHEGAGRIGHTDDCNSVMGWGNNCRCDCYVDDVYQALDALKGSVLDDIVAELNDR